MSANIPTPSNPWFGVSMVLIGVVVGYLGANTMGGEIKMAADAPSVAAPTPTAAAPTPAAPSAQAVVAVTDEDHIRGDKDATISVIEYSDFECPFCARHHPTMQQIVEDFDDVNWVYRHYPLSFHPNAQKSAEASECAAEQDQFWAYADLLIEQGADINRLSAYAEQLNLNVSDFETCLNSGKYAQKVKDQMDSGSASGVSGTPGNIVYNNKTKESRLVSGAQQISAFEAAINALK